MLDAFAKEHNPTAVVFSPITAQLASTGIRSFVCARPVMAISCSNTCHHFRSQPPDSGAEYAGP